MSRHQSFMSKRVTGSVLALASLLLLYLIFSNIAVLGLLGAWLVSLPIFLLVFLGAALMLNVRIRRSVESWLVFTIATALPWSIIIPTGYQILVALVLSIVILSLLYWYRRKYQRQRTPQM